MPLSSHLALPYVDAAQAQKHVTHNEAIQLLDALVHLTVLQRSVATPPASPPEGRRLLIGAGASGAFAGKEKQIAAFLAGAWVFLPPRAGWRAYVEAERLLLIYDGSDWIDAGGAVGALQNIPRLGVGATADAGNPLTAKLNTTLFTARYAGEGGDGDLRFKLNKEASGDTVSQLYQTNFSGRAETGLAGDDKFHVKVSADGATWKEALVVDNVTGYVRVGTASPSEVLDIAAGNIDLDDTRFAAQHGVVKKNGVPFIHNFNYGNNGAVTTLGDNLFVGKNAGNFTMGGTATLPYHASNNVGIGPGALAGLTTGYINLAFGPGALAATTSGYYNIAISPRALQFNQTGSNNIAIGADAMQANVSGGNNIAIGADALIYNYTGIYNIGIGAGALFYNRTGAANFGAGRLSLYDLGSPVTAGSFVVGVTHTIASVGTTDFTAIGAASNAVGVSFTATGVGSGTGTAAPGGTNANTALGYNTGRGIVYGGNNTIVGANVAGLPANLSGAIILGTGEGTIRADFNKSVAGAWALSAPMQLPTFTVATLPAASGGAGLRAFVSDATSAVFGAIVAGGGAVFTPVYSDGANWRMG